MTYLYKCLDCQKEHEQSHKLTEKPTPCVHWKSVKLRRLIAGGTMVHPSWASWRS
jgi:predicted nucleic acid-binding Zn ribbon protein